MDLRHLFFSFEGRINRRPYWIGLSLILAVEFVCWMLVASLGTNERMLAIVELALNYPGFALALKRANDREMSLTLIVVFFVLDGMLSALTVLDLSGPPDEVSGPLLILFVPWFMVGVYLLIKLGFYRGVPGPNRFGPDPLQ